jgi:biopolymer transport protein ExbB/TolQ
MRGSIWTVVALGSGLALVPAIIDVDSPDATGQTVLDVVGSLAPVLGLLLFVTGMAVVISLVTSDGF